MIATQTNSRVRLDLYNHVPGGSCMVTALSGIYRYKGLDYNPAQIVGLGAGLHFAYGYNPINKNYRIEFLSSQLSYSLLSNTGVYCEEFELVDSDQAMSRMFTLLDSGMPVPVLLNPTYCEGLMKRTPPEFVPYIPSHMVVVYGYDKAKNEVYLYDSPQFDPLVMSIDRLKEGRNSGDTNPSNKHYEFYFPKTLYPYEVSAKLAIARVISVYKYSEKHLAHRSGIDAIGRFSNNVKGWRSIFTDEEIQDNARLFLMAVTNGHATKSGFRTQYAKFLEHVSENTQGNGFYESAKAYKELGQLWVLFQKFLTILIKDPSNEEIWKENSDFMELLTKLETCEVRAINLLEQNLKAN